MPAAVQPLGSRDSIRGVAGVHRPEAALAGFGKARADAIGDPRGSGDSNSDSNSTAMVLAALGLAALIAARAPRQP